MYKEKLFSIIVPLYNAELYIRKCVESILNQGFCNWEMIIVDDGSTDGSYDICREYLNDERITLVRIKNSGVSVARNEGIKRATGDYIIFLDADDYYLDGALKVMRDGIESYTNPDLVIYNYYSHGKGGRLTSRFDIESVGIYNTKEDIWNIINTSVKLVIPDLYFEYGNLHSVWGKCFRRQIITDNELMFENKLKYGEDMVFVINYLKYCSCVLVKPDRVYAYRLNMLSAMNSRRYAGPEQGEQYFLSVSEIVGDRGCHNDLRQLWNEIAENDWKSIVSSNISLRRKIAAFSELNSTELYRRFSCGQKEDFFSWKQRVYCFWTRHDLSCVQLVVFYIRKISDAVILTLRG